MTAKSIAEMIGGPVEYLPRRPGDVLHTLADFSQAEQILGWRPRVGIEEGVAELLQLNKSDDDSERSHVT